MECAETTWPTDREYLQQFNRKAVALRVPLSGGIDLTHRCNLRCRHCYLGPQPAVWAKRKHEMSTSRLLSLIDEITDAGCLYLLITGGEPLLRKDFAEIYRYARTKGLLVTVFTNATLVTDRILGLFKVLPPHVVEVSLYGASAETYEKITGIRGSYERCLEGIKQLLKHKMNVRLKTILMTLNRHEFFNIENMAKEFGVRFRLDAAIFPCLDGDKTPLSLRVPPEEAVEKEFSDNERLRHWRDYFVKHRALPVSDMLYNCGAGLTSFHIDPYGNLQPCLMTTSLKYNLSAGNFITGWHGVIPRIRGKEAGAVDTCNRCEKQALCNFCPAFFELESGAEDRCSDYLCRMGQHRFRSLDGNLQSREK
jgi:radical SAM protein with 4Fe4S-binding SPASM domain